MYVAPRPDLSEDPLFGVRLGLVGALCFVAVALLNPGLPTIVAALPVGLIAAQRRAFSLPRAVAGPVAAGVVALLMAWLMTAVQERPLIHVGAVWLIFFAGFRMILRSGAAPGMLLVVMGVVFSVVGMSGDVAVALLLHDFLLGAGVALVVAPLAYALCPARTAAPQVDAPTPTEGDVDIGAAIRATVLLGLSFWLYAVMPASDIMMAIMAALVLVFPTRERVFFEAQQRLRSTLYGAGLTVMVLAGVALVPHPPILFGLVFLAGLWVGERMLRDPRPHFAYQNAYPAMMALVAGALSSQDPGAAILSRIVLTLVGAFAAAYAVAVLDKLAGWRS